MHLSLQSILSLRATAYICPTRPRLYPVPKTNFGTGNPSAYMYLASYFTPGHVAIDMGVFSSDGVREYACSGLYLVVDPGAGTA